jgi:threonine/homoserine/homoserine lactone efflux protein
VTLSSLLIFAGVYFAAVASPGPGVIWLMLAVTGLAVIAKAFAGVFVAIKFAGAAYLLTLAWRTTVVGAPPPAASRDWRALLGSLSLTLGNPKAMVFFLSIMPLAVDVRTLTVLKLAELAAVSAMVIFSTLATYALAANRARAFLSSTRAMRFVRRAAGGLMAGVAVAVAAR